MKTNSSKSIIRRLVNSAVEKLEREIDVENETFERKSKRFDQGLVYVA